MKKYRKIVVTGGSGLLGRYLKKILPDATYFSSKDYNLLEQVEIRKMFKKLKPDILIHLAATVGGVHHNILEPVKYFDNNIIMNTLILHEAFKSKVERFITVLSSCVFPDKIKKYPISEDMLHQGSPHEDLFSYAYSKRCMALQIENYNKKYSTKYNYLIPCNLYGEYDKFDSIKGHFVGALLHKIYLAKKHKKKSITLFGDGSPLRQFMYAEDLALIIKKTLENNIYENFNVATNENYSVSYIANIALKACRATHLHIKYDIKKPNGQLRKDIDNKKMLKLFPNIKLKTLYEGISEIYNKKFLNYE